MAEYSIPKGKIGAHAHVLVPGIVDTVVFGEDLSAVEVISNGAAELYFTVDAAAPTVGDTGAFYMPAAPSVRGVPSEKMGGETVVRLISDGSPRYSVARPS